METEILTISPPSLTRTELKPLLVDRIKKQHPSFRFLMAATGVYHFQRIREFYDYDLKEALHFVFSQEDGSMHVSISSRLNPVHTLTPVYNNGFVNPHIDLGALVKCQGIFPSPQTAYQCDGRRENLIRMIDQALDDFSTEGLAYLDNRWRSLKASDLVWTGMNIIDKWDHDKTMLRNEINVQMRRAKLVFGKLRHPIYNQLKEELEAVPNQTNDDCNEIPRLAFELLELYCNSRIIS